MRIECLAVLCGIIPNLLTISAASLPQSSNAKPLETRQTSSGPMVFAHYMLVFQPPNNDYTNDINLAKAAGIDAFAVNFEGPDWASTEGWLTKFYTQAQDLDFKLFISIDTTSVTDKNIAANVSKTFATWDSQLKVNGQVVLSSFSVNPPLWDWQTDIIDQIGQPVLFLPGDLTETSSAIPNNHANFGHFTWIHPANPAIGEPVNGQLTEQSIDEDFAKWQTPSKPWMAGVAPYYFRALEPDNWLNAQDDNMWVDRWMHLLKVKPSFIEIVTWNDFGESSYVGPANTQSTEVDYYGNLTHTAFYNMAKVFIKAYKAGQTEVSVTPEDEDVFFMYRTQPAESNGIQDTANWQQSLPKNATSCENNVYIFSFLTSPTTVYLKSGETTYPVQAQEGVSKGTVPFQFGDQSITASRSLHYGKLQKSGPSISGKLDKYNGNVFAI